MLMLVGVLEDRYELFCRTCIELAFPRACAQNLAGVDPDRPHGRLTVLVLVLVLLCFSLVPRDGLPFSLLSDLRLLIPFPFARILFPLPFIPFLFLRERLCDLRRPLFLRAVPCRRARNDLDRELAQHRCDFLL